VGEKLRTIAQGVSKQVAAMVERELLQCLYSLLGALSCNIVLQKQAKPCKTSGIVLHIAIYKYQGWQVCIQCYSADKTGPQE